MLLRRGLLAVLSGAVVGATVLVPVHIDAAPAVSPEIAISCLKACDTGCVDVCDTDLDVDGSPADLDCNDNDNTIFPGATEKWADGVDQDCDGKEICYYDGDSDGARHVDGSIMSIDLDCTDLHEASAAALVDCDDEDDTVQEVCEADEPTPSTGGESGGSIPATGSGSGMSILLASVLLAGGFLTLLFARRRPLRT